MPVPVVIFAPWRPWCYATCFVWFVPPACRGWEMSSDNAKWPSELRLRRLLEDLFLHLVTSKRYSCHWWQSPCYIEGPIRPMLAGKLSTPGIRCVIYWKSCISCPWKPWKPQCYGHKHHCITILQNPNKLKRIFETETRRKKNTAYWHIDLWQAQLPTKIRLNYLVVLGKKHFLYMRT